MAQLQQHPTSATHTDAINSLSQPLTGHATDYDRLLDEIGDSRLVLIGEGSHGTHEFYRERAAITRRLIEERGFTAVAGEADWPDAFRVNRFVRNMSDDRNADDALDDFRRFPQWMWRNTVVRDFAGWLRDYNDTHRNRKVGFYGLDLYSLHASIQAVITYLDKVDPAAADRARERYSCFDHFGQDAQSYGLATSYGAAESCEDDVVEQLVELRTHAAQLAMQDGQAAEDEFFSAQQNARLAKNAEQYYRAMFQGRVSSWNLRDLHMAETLDSLLEYLTERNGVPAKIVVWAHNSHLGDARATEMGEAGELNLGQLARTRHGQDTFLIGQTTYEGTVTAASNWDEPAQRKNVRPGLPGSYEGLFHDVRHEAFLLSLREDKDVVPTRQLERAIGVIYRPETERQSHYFGARLASQFDVVIHQDHTRALHPLERIPEWDRDEVPETYPTGDVPPRPQHRLAE